MPYNSKKKSGHKRVDGKTDKQCEVCTQGKLIQTEPGALM